MRLSDLMSFGIVTKRESFQQPTVALTATHPNKAVRARPIAVFRSDVVRHISTKATPATTVALTATSQQAVRARPTQRYALCWTGTHSLLGGGGPVRREQK